MMVNFVSEDKIGELFILTSKQLEKFRRSRPLLQEVIDYAIVKEFEDGSVLIEKSRLNFDLSYGQNEEDNV